MTHPLFLAPLPVTAVGFEVSVTGDEARHAVTVRRISVGETVMVADGAGHAVEGRVVGTGKTELRVRVDTVLPGREPALQLTAVQALAKGDRSDLAVEMLTEVGAERIVAWQASRSIVRWQGDRRDRSLSKWQATAREATKQSRRFRVPEVSYAETRTVAKLLGEVDLALVLHEHAAPDISDVSLPGRGRVAVVIGPEGGVSQEELSAFAAAGALAVRVSDAVLRTSTAGAVALSQIQALARSRR